MSGYGDVTTKEAGVEVLGSKESIGPNVEVKEMSKDEHRLATLGYKQVSLAQLSGIHDTMLMIEITRSSSDPSGCSRTGPPLL